MKNKKAAMEMSMGTIVTIILLVVVLVLGIFFIQRIFGTGTDAIDQIDTQVQNEINKLFTEEGKKVVVYPNSREISLKQGDSGGFGFSIKNVNRGDNTHRYSYKVDATGESDCRLSASDAKSYIQLGKEGEFYLSSGQILENAVLVKYYIPETAPLCLIRYNLVVEEEGKPYSTVSVDLEIK